MTPTISCHALAGINTPQTLKIKGYIKKKKVIVLIDFGSTHNFIHCKLAKALNCFIYPVGRLVVVIDVNPSHGFWTARLMKVFGHEGQCTCRYNTHGWIVYIMLFPVVCGTSRGSSWLRRNEFLKMTK
jgi:hypothetical protein